MSSRGSMPSTPGQTSECGGKNMFSLLTLIEENEYLVFSKIFSKILQNSLSIYTKIHFNSLTYSNEFSLVLFLHILASLRASIIAVYLFYVVQPLSLLVIIENISCPGCLCSVCPQAAPPWACTRSWYRRTRPARSPSSTSSPSTWTSMSGSPRTTPRAITGQSVRKMSSVLNVFN